MPWQGHLLIGQRVHDWVEVLEIFRTLGVHEFDALYDRTQKPGYDPLGEDRDWSDDLNVEIQEAIWDMETKLERTIVHKGVTYEVQIEFRHEGEGGALFPVPKDEEYTDACVYFSLTQRYRGAVLDFAHEKGGRPEPFEFDPQDIAHVLAQVNEWWPEAKAMIWTKFY
jgi:hypothetical protein